MELSVGWSPSPKCRCLMLFTVRTLRDKADRALLQGKELYCTFALRFWEGFRGSIMVPIAQLVERWIVVPDVESSNLFGHPTETLHSLVESLFLLLMVKKEWQRLGIEALPLFIIL